MGDRDFAFEERKVNEREQEKEYYKGGGGGSSNGFFSIKTNVYSRQCYSDPNNPGKMICKETNNQSGFDPFNQEKNYRKMNENVYTQEVGNAKTATRNYDNYEDKSFFGKISDKLKGLFSEDSQQYQQPKYTNNESYRDNYKDPYLDPFSSSSNQHDNHFNFRPNFDDHNNKFDPYQTDQFDRVFRSLQNEFFKKAFFDSEDFENENDFFDPLINFFSNYDHHHNFNHDHGHPNLNNFDNIPRSSYHNQPHIHPSDNQVHFPHKHENIKYCDSKIYDV